MSLIELKNAVKEYTAGDITVRALNELNIAVQQGEIIVILGQSCADRNSDLYSRPITFFRF